MSAAWRKENMSQEKFCRVLQWALKQRNLVESVAGQSGAIEVHGDQEELCVGAIEERGEPDGWRGPKQ